MTILKRFNVKSTLALLFASLLFVGCQQAKTTYQITGTLPQNSKVDTLTLNDFNRTIVAKIPVSGNSFNFKGSVEQPTKVRLKGGRFHGTFILENDEYALNFENGEVNVKGGKLNELIYGYKKSEAYINAKDNYSKVSDEEYTGLNFSSAEEQDVKAVKEARRKVGLAAAVVSKIESEYQKSIIEGDYPAYTRLLALEPTTYGLRNFEKYVAAVDKIKKDIDKNNPNLLAVEASIERRKKNIEKSKNFVAGKKYTDVTATTIDGKKISLSDVVTKNKYTLIEFWASWCGPCRASFPHLKKVYGKYNDKGFEVLGISLDKNEKNYLKASKEEEIPWINAVDLKGVKGDAAKAYNVQGIPFTVLISQDGTIIDAGENIRDSKLDEKLKELFKE